MNENHQVQNGSIETEFVANNASASACTVLEFASYDSTTFELWSKAFRKTLLRIRASHTKTKESRDKQKDLLLDNAKQDEKSQRSNWISPGHDCKISLLQSEIWCTRVLENDMKKIASEIRRLTAMEDLVSQITSDNVVLLVYQKVSRVHEMFAANSRREMEGIPVFETPLSSKVLDFFSDHLKRKYSVFLSLALSSNLLEEDIRGAHEEMCRENKADFAGIGGSAGESFASSTAYGFDSPECIELYAKYRVAASSYYSMNFADAAAAEEEDAIMHLPVTVYVALLQHNTEKAEALFVILNNVKERLKNATLHEEETVATHDKDDK